MPAAPTTVDGYIRQFPPATRKKLQAVRDTILRAAPGATETISYGMPTYVLHGTLVHLAAYAQHLGLYGAGPALGPVQAQAAAYLGGRGTLKFPLDAPVPLALVKKLVKLRVQQNLERATARPGDAGALPRSIGQPATRALHAAGFKNLRQLTRATPAQLLELHGFGPRALAILKKELKALGLALAAPGPRARKR